MESSKVNRKPLSVRAKAVENGVAAKLLNIMEEKKTNLCLAVDIDSSSELISLAKLIGPHICILKIHSNHYTNFNEIKDELVALSQQFKFLLFDDAKYGDTGETVRRSYAQVVDWADIVTVHGLFGQKLIDSLKEESKKLHEPRGIFVVCEMSSEDNPYQCEPCRNRAVKLAQMNKDSVVGVIAQKLFIGDELIKATPGVHLSATGDNLGQTFRTPEAVMESGTDIVIVGRGITSAPDDQAKLARALDYKLRCFEGLMASMSS